MLTQIFRFTLSKVVLLIGITVLLLTGSMLENNNYSSSGWLEGFLVLAGYYLSILISVCALIVEVISWFRKTKFSFTNEIAILSTLTTVSVFIAVYYMIWSSEVEEIIIIPNQYNKRYVAILYGVPGAPEYVGDWSWNRKRIIHIPTNGFYKTSTIVKTTAQIPAMPEIYTEDGKFVKRLSVYSSTRLSISGKELYVLPLDSMDLFVLDSIVKSDWKKIK